MSALGDTFRAARESQGLTFSDVAERIHIRSVYLAAIEAEDWNAIGPPVYVRGFVRTYARCLGLDPDAAVAGFSDGSQRNPLPAASFSPAPRGERQGKSIARAERPAAAGSRAERSVSGGPRTPARKPGLSLGAVAGVFVALALVLFVAYEYFDYQRGQSGVASAGRAPSSAAASAQPERVVRESHRPATETRSTGKDEERPGFALRLQDSSWLRVVVDGKVAMEGLYPKGTVRAFSGRSATVRVGNAGGVDISVEGKDLGPMGGLGDVAERSFQL